MKTPKSAGFSCGLNRRALSLKSRAVFDDLFGLAMSLRNPTVRFGSSVPSYCDLAKIIACEVDEVSEAIAELARFQLVEVMPDGAVKVIALQGAFERSEINRANGRRGGRPKGSGKVM